MATAKFKTESPFANNIKNTGHSSDLEYQSFVENISRTSGSNGPFKEVGLALFGLGRAGTLHLNNILSDRDIKLLYIVEVDENKSEFVKEKFHLDDVTFLKPEDSVQVFKDPNVLATLIATPTSSHEELICKSLRSNCHVFAEKPISQTEEGTARCYHVAKEMNKKLFCAFNRRFDPSLMDVKNRVEKGEVGHIQVIKTTSRDSPLPSIEYLKISNGIFHDCAVHDIDLITWITGEYPTEVYSVASALIPEIKDIDDVDTVAITLKFPSGTIGIIDLSRFAVYGYDQRLEVFGRKSLIQVNNSCPNATEASTTHGLVKVPIFYSFPSRYAKSYSNELKHFVKVVQGCQNGDFEGLDTMAVSKIATACEKSAKSGKPINIKWTKEEIPSNYNMVV